MKTNRRLFLKAATALGGSLILPMRGLGGELLRDRSLHCVQHSTFVMGQIANVTIYHHDVAAARRAVTSIFSELRSLESKLSLYDESSDVCAINRAAGKGMVAVSESTRSIIARSIEASRRTGDAFDITVNPLLMLWGFRGTPRLDAPSAGEVEEALASVGIDGITIDGDKVGLAKSGASIDLGGVAVGYALDTIAAMLRDDRITSALLEISGDFYAIGTPPDSRRGWRIGIQDPRTEGGIWKELHIRDQALSTSGNYASTVVYNARSFGHIFDPADGYPAGRILSATVVAPTAIEADIYSTALFVSGSSSILPSGSNGYLL